MLSAPVRALPVSGVQHITDLPQQTWVDCAYGNGTTLRLN